MRNLWAKKILVAIISMCLVSIDIMTGAKDIFAAEEEKIDLNEPEGKENSWRYENGKSIYDEETVIKEFNYPDAWEKVEGYYRNSEGDIIEKAVRKGIDISEHNGKLDWNKIKNSDIDYVILRCGYGMDETDQDDKYWEYNVSECERLGIPYGVYLYSYTTGIANSESEAKHAIRLLKGYTPTFPVYYDLEENRTQNLSESVKGQCAKIFCDALSEAGYQTGIYANLWWWDSQLTDPVFDNSSWSKWIAQYAPKCDYGKNYDMWQCTAEGEVYGIDGKVDINFWMNENYVPGKLPAVKNLSAKSKSHIQVELKWDKVINSDGYIIYRMVDGETKFSYLSMTTGTAYTDIKAAAKKTNYYRIYPYYIEYNGKRVLGYSNTYVYAIPMLGTVKNLKAESYGKRKVNISWDKVQDAEGYVIYRRVGNGSFKYYYMTNTNTFVDSAASETDYNFYRIYPYYRDEQKKVILGPSNAYVYAKGILPAVTGLKARNGNSNVTVSWDPVIGAEGYIIYRRVGNGEFEYRYMVKNTEFKDTSASKNQYNFYRVYPYYLINGIRILNQQSSYVYGKAK